MTRQIFDDKVNISIRWKIVGAFLIVSSIPLLMMAAGASFPVAAFTGLLVATSFGIYSGWRIVRSLDLIREKLNRVPGHETLASGNADELNQLMHWADNIVSGLETTLAKTTGAPGKERKPIDPKARAVIRGRFATGMPVSGKIKVIRESTSPARSAAPTLTPAQCKLEFDSIVQDVSRELTELKSVLTNEDEQGILNFQLLLLEDQTFLDGIISSFDHNAGVREAIEQSFAPFIQKMRASKSSYMREREQDCRDLMRRLEKSRARRLEPTAPVGEDVKGRVVYVGSVFPSEIVEWKKRGLAGLLLKENSLTSHAQILLESLAIPSVSRFDADLSALDDCPVFLNPQKRRMIINPAETDLPSIHESHASGPHEAIRTPAQLHSGETIHVHASIGLAQEAPQALSEGADGIGLYRSEFNFMAGYELPDEDTLYEEYLRVTTSFAGKPVTFRMLDLGGDKIAAFQSHIHEDNPSMGERSMRLLLNHPALFRSQLRAMLRAAHDQTSIIYPMISSLDEVNRIEALKDEVVLELKAEGVTTANVKYGIMVETPAVVERFDDYARRFDMFNLGTNDLTQYALAADRTNPHVSDYYHQVHPSVLSMIEKVARHANHLDRTLCFCGESAADTRYLPLFIGFGVRSFSVSSSMVQILKHHITRLDLADCEKLSRRILTLETIEQIQKALSIQSSPL